MEKKVFELFGIYLAWNAGILFYAIKNKLDLELWGKFMTFLWGSVGLWNVKIYFENRYVTKSPFGYGMLSGAFGVTLMTFIGAYVSFL